MSNHKSFSHVDGGGKFLAWNTEHRGVLKGRMKMQVLKNQVPWGGIIKYGKTKYEWQGWKMQVRKKQVQMCGGGKCKYGKMKYD